MPVTRRRVLGVSLLSVLSAGCLSDPSLSMAFDLSIENHDRQPRELSVVVERVGEAELYNETHQLAPGEERTEPAVVESSGRYRIGVTDSTVDEARTDERHVELSTGAGFCGMFVVRAEPESVLVSVPRCPDETNTSTDGPDP